MIPVYENIFISFLDAMKGTVFLDHALLPWYSCHGTSWLNSLKLWAKLKFSCNLGIFPPATGKLMNTIIFIYKLWSFISHIPFVFNVRFLLSISSVLSRWIRQYPFHVGKLSIHLHGKSQWSNYPIANQNQFSKWRVITCSRKHIHALKPRGLPARRSM